MNCSQVLVFQIMPVLCLHGHGRTGTGVVYQIRAGLDRGRGVPKIPKFLPTSFIDDPKVALKFFIKKRLQRKYFPVDIVKFLRTVFAIEH